MHVTFARAARQDLFDIVEYIAADNPTAAENVYHHIVAAAERLADFPAMGRSGWLPGTRELVVPSLHYIVAYQVNAARDTLTILAVFHGARDLVRALTERRRQAKKQRR